MTELPDHNASALPGKHIILLDISLAINIVGLMVITALESWRPGYVSVAVNVGVVWLVAVGLLSVGWSMKRGIAKLTS